MSGEDIQIYTHRHSIPTSTYIEIPGDSRFWTNECLEENLTLYIELSTTVDIYIYMKYYNTT